MDAPEGCLSEHSTSLLYSIGRPLRVVFEPSTYCLFQQEWSQWKSFIHTPVVLLPPILQKERSDKAAALLVALDCMAKSTMIRSDSTAVFAFRTGSSLPSLVVSQCDCMAEIRSAYQVEGFHEDVTNILPASYSILPASYLRDRDRDKSVPRR